jgi:hypothetical protein
MNNNNYDSIVRKLSRTRSSISRWLAIEGFANLLAFAGAFIFFLWALTFFYWSPPAFRVGMITIGLIAVLIFIGLNILKPFIKKTPFTQVALRLEKSYGKLQSRLIASLELYDKLLVNRENYSVALIEKTIEEAGGEIKDLDFRVAVYKRKRPYQRLALSLLVLIFAFVVSERTFSHVALLYSNPMLDIPRPTNLTLEMTPLFPQVIKNEDVTITITASGEKVRRIDFNFRFDDDRWVSVPAEKVPDEEGGGDSTFTYTFRKIKRDITFFARAKEIKTSTGQVSVLDPPNLIDVSIKLVYPAYTGLPDQELALNDGSVTAIRGTDVFFTGKLNKPVKSAVMVFDDGSRRELAIESEKLSGRFAVNRNGSYHIEVADEADLKNPHPIEYDIVCLEDYHPQVNITFPAVDIDLDESMTVPIEASLFDDFGFSKLELVYWRFSEGKEYARERSILKRDFGEETEVFIRYNWYLEPLHLLPGDLVYYYLEVYDNDAVSGSKSSVSKTYSARLPSLDEIMADITGSQEEVYKDFSEVVGTQRELRDELKELSREMLKLSEVDWEKKQQIQGTLDRQKEIADKLEEIADQMEETIEKFEKNQLATAEMLEKMEEIRELFEEVATPELREAMKKLQEALEKMDPDLIQQAMKNFELSVEQINENLDRMLAIMQKFQLEQKLDTLAKMAQKLAEQQQQINEQLGQCNSDKEVSDLQMPQQQQQQGLNNLRDQFEQTKELNRELNMLSQQDLQNADSKVNSPELDQMMSQMMQNLGMCNAGKSSQSGQKLEQDFQDMAQMFQQMLQRMQNQQMAMLTGMIRKAIADILYLSHDQENIIDSSQRDISLPENRREIASRQKDIETAVDRVARNVSELTRESLFINTSVMERLGAALKSMQEAIEKLNARTPTKVQSSQVEAMAALNKSVEILMSSLDQLSQCQSSSCTGMQSMMQKLSQMASQQQMLNQQTQMMLPIPGQQALTLSQQQALQRMAAQQESIRKNLQELLDEYTGSTDGQLLGRIDELGEEMKKVSEQLKAHNLDRHVVQRQERILSRLLDAQKSVNRRDYSRRREARTAGDIIRRGPQSLSSGNTGDEKLAEDIKKALTEKYPRRYENQIKEYFKALAEDRDIE